jgi:hypothetical protein
MDSPDNGLGPRETVEVIEALKKRGFSDAQFKALHHLHDSLAGFQRYCLRVNRFVIGGNNDRLARQLKKILDS